MSRIVSEALEFLALCNHTAASRAARVALGVGLSLAVHAGAWFGVNVAPPSVPMPRAALTATLLPKPLALESATFVLPPHLIEMVETPPPVKNPSVEEPEALPPQGALELAQNTQPQATAEEQSDSSQIVLTQPDAVFYTAGDVDRGAFNLRDIKPEYPTEAHVRGVEGIVDLRIYIDEAGFVRDVIVDLAEPSGFFEEAAIAAFRSAQFSPAYKNERAVKSQKKIRVSFSLTEKGEE